MFEIFGEVAKKCTELEKLRIMAQTGQIIYRQRGELYTAERFKKMESGLAQAICLLNESMQE